MADELAGKIAVITGGASGLGLASVRLFLEEGARVVLADIDPRGADIAAELGPDCLFRRTDVSIAEDIDAAVASAVETFGGLHIMFNNAGIPTPMARLLDDPLDDFDRIMRINLLGVIRGTQVAARHMAKNGGGSIINTSSVAGSLPSFGITNYRASKAAVIHFTKCAAIELGEHDIRVNCLTPALIETEMTRQSASNSSDISSEMADRLTLAIDEIVQSMKPMRRRGYPRDVANAVMFLGSDRSAYITGMVVPLDGGSSAGFTTNQVDQMEEARQRILSEG